MMKTSDILDDAIAALHDEGTLADDRKRVLKARVLAGSKRRSRHVVRWVMPLAAVLATASVWASVAKHHRDAPLPPITPAVVVAMPPAVLEVTTPVATPSAAPLEPSPVAAVRESVHAVPPKTKVVAAPPPIDDSELAAIRAYREAEHLQFDTKDYAAALDAWDRYLPLAGRSPLAVDARYWRGACLVRLGRSDEARAALTPFARGDWGAYRQADAQSLIDSIR